MLKTYFFIPANVSKFIGKAATIPSDYIVFDLEDSVAFNEIDEALGNLKCIDIRKNYFVRPALFAKNKLDVDKDMLHSLIDIGFTNFIIPKFSDILQLAKLKEIFALSSLYDYHTFKFVILVEHPAGLLFLKEAVQSKQLNISALALGNYDYCNAMGMKHNLENLYYARQTILNTARAYDLSAIDIVTLDYKDREAFCSEVLNGFSMGFDSKFLIHPMQLEQIHSIKYYSDEEVAEARELYPKILEMMHNKTSIVKLNGKIFEKPHINRIINIINWNNRYGSK